MFDRVSGIMYEMSCKNLISLNLTVNCVQAEILYQIEFTSIPQWHADGGLNSFLEKNENFEPLKIDLLFNTS